MRLSHFSSYATVGLSVPGRYPRRLTNERYSKGGLCYGGVAFVWAGAPGASFLSELHPCTLHAFSTGHCWRARGLARCSFFSDSFPPSQRKIRRKKKERALTSAFKIDFVLPNPENKLICISLYLYLATIVSKIFREFLFYVSD